MKWLLKLFRHRHGYAVVCSTFHPQYYHLDGRVSTAHYTYERIEYDFCVGCGEKRVV